MFIMLVHIGISPPGRIGCPTALSPASASRRAGQGATLPPGAPRRHDGQQPDEDEDRPRTEDDGDRGPNLAPSSWRGQSTVSVVAAAGSTLWVTAHLDSTIGLVSGRGSDYERGNQ